MSSPSSTPFAAIVVAAGAGTRFGGGRPKALLELAGRPLVVHAVRTMIDAGCAELVVVVPTDSRAAFLDVLSKMPLTAMVNGGQERTHSVRKGLAGIAEAGTTPPITLITDAARPLVPQIVVERVVAAVADGATAVVPAVPVTDTIRVFPSDDGGDSTMLDRSRLRAVQTPQGFATTALIDAYDRLGDAVVTDDAGVCEQAGHQVVIVDGAPASFKITYPADLALAELMMAAKESIR